MRSITSRRTSSTVPNGNVFCTLTPPWKHSRSPYRSLSVRGHIPVASNWSASSTSIPMSMSPGTASITDPSVWYSTLTPCSWITRFRRTWCGLMSSSHVSRRIIRPFCVPMSSAVITRSIWPGALSSIARR